MREMRVLGEGGEVFWVKVGKGLGSGEEGLVKMGRVWVEGLVEVRKGWGDVGGLKVRKG